MKLLKIGRSQDNDIVLKSPKSSARHAELTIMNSGEILLEDKNSTNGTYLMGKRIQSSTPVSVKRGDRIQFADEELSWSMIPVPEDNSNYKAIYGIGTNFRNEIQMEGSTVSRFHATLKIDKNGKAFIIDHSTNGTTVNGNKIPANHPVRIKKGDSVVCGGIPVDLSSHIPVPIKKISLFSAAGIAVIAAMVLLIAKIPFRPVAIEAMEGATVCVYGQYYIDIEFEDDPIAKIIPDWASNWTMGIYNGKLELVCNVNDSRKSEVQPIGYSGTAFFVSNYGELATNRHVALPWDYLTEKQEEMVRQKVALYLNSGEAESWLNFLIKWSGLDFDEAQAMLDRLRKSNINISGHHDILGICYNGTMINNYKDMENAQVIAVSQDKKKDIALLRLNSKMTPRFITDKGIYNLSNARTDFTKLKPQEEILTIGYPGGLEQGLSSFNIIGKELRSTTRRSFVSKKPNEDNFEIQMEIIGGGSGSPVMDSHNRLLGIAFGSLVNSGIGYVCNIKHFCELYEKNKVQ